MEWETKLIYPTPPAYCKVKSSGPNVIVRPPESMAIILTACEPCSESCIVHCGLAPMHLTHGFPGP
jgi:hypothetical protein